MISTQPAIVRSFDDYRRRADQIGRIVASRARFERNLIRSENTFSVPGFCWACQEAVDFLGDFRFCREENGVRIPNWRERLECPQCRLNNRLRAIVHLFEVLFAPAVNSRIYATEQVTPFFDFLASRYPNLVGSEFLGPSIPLGAVREDGVRNESLTSLSFANESCDFVLCFEVLEHVPDYQRAMRELARVLAPDGRLLLTVPFDCNRTSNLVRASLAADGTIVHYLPPEYHGDPISEDGCLCFQVFSWGMFEELKKAGFRDVYAAFYWAPEFGYLGGDQMAIVAQK